MAQRREDLRVADVDRAFVADRLKTAVDEGRLSLGEYDERLRDTYAARTYGDLDRLLHDLPGGAPGEAPAPAPAGGAMQPVPEGHGTVGAPGGPQPQPSKARSVPRWLAAVWGAWLVAVSVNVVIWALVSISAGGPIYFWPMWVAGPWGAVLFATTISGLASGSAFQPDAADPVRDRATRKAEARAARERRHDERRARRAEWHDELHARKAEWRAQRRRTRRGY